MPRQVYCATVLRIVIIRQHVSTSSKHVFYTQVAGKHLTKVNLFENYVLMFILQISFQNIF